MKSKIYLHFALILGINSLFTISYGLDGCNTGQWECADGACINTSEVCDGNDDCSDGSDETNCDLCPDGEISCTDGACINTSEVCDGNDDCSDGSDETNCGTGNEQDTTPPVLESVSFTPSALDVTSGPDTITFTIGYSDDLSGVFRVYLSVVSPSGGQSEYKYFWPEAVDTQTTIDLEIAQFSESGEWVINYLTLLDNVDNSVYYYANNQYGNWNPVWPTTFHVTSEQDITYPVLESVSIDPSFINVTEDPDTITFTIGYSDDLSGMDNGYLRIQSPIYGQYFDKWFGPENDGDTQSTFDLAIPQYGESGDWQISFIKLQDNAGNTHYYYPTEENDWNPAFQTTFNVTSDQEDIVYPTLTSILFTPAVLYVMTGPDTMTVTIGHADNISGVYRGNLKVQSPIYNQVVEKWFYPEEGDTQTTFNLEIPQYAESGNWLINSVRLDDNVGNYHYYYANNSGSDWDSAFQTTFNVNYGDNCPIGQWTCSNGDCIETSKVCDGVFDCSDGGDQTICGSCNPGNIACNDSTCGNLCDGVDDCSDGADEISCGVSIDDVDLNSLTTPLECMSDCPDYGTITSQTTSIDYCTWLMESYDDGIGSCVLDCLGNTASTLMLTLATDFCESCIELEGQGQGGCDLACVNDIALDGICETCEDGVIVDNDADDDDVCNADEVTGCWYENACNYNAMATDDDGSCEFIDGICETCEGGQLVDNDDDNDGICNADEVVGCTTSTACNYNALATDDDGSCEFVDGICETCEDGAIVDNDADDDSICNADDVIGCTTSTACNYNAMATDDDGSCEFVDGICETCEDGAIVDNDADDDDVCNADEVTGCRYENACNYNAMATDDDGSCEFVDGICETCEDGAVVDNDADDDSICNADEVVGCTTSTACNYNAMATDDDGSCTFVDGICETCEDGAIVDNDADDDDVCNDSDHCAGFDDTVDTDGDGTPDGCDLSLYNGLIPVEFSIHNIYPNPFNPVTNIIYGLPEHVNVQIIIYDLAGKQVETLINEFQTPGYHSVSWNADNHPSGLYLVNMTSGSYVKTQKLILVK